MVNYVALNDKPSCMYSIGHFFVGSKVILVMYTCTYQQPVGLNDMILLILINENNVIKRRDHVKGDKLDYLIEINHQQIKISKFFTSML